MNQSDKNNSDNVLSTLLNNFEKLFKTLEVIVNALELKASFLLDSENGSRKQYLLTRALTLKPMINLMKFEPYNNISELFNLYDSRFIKLLMMLLLESVKEYKDTKSSEPEQTLHINSWGFKFEDAIKEINDYIVKEREKCKDYLSQIH